MAADDALAVWAAELEVRQRSGGGRELRGRFPYNRTATVRNRGRVRKERIRSRAFRFALEDAEREIHLLAGHEYGKPLASRRAGSLRLEDSDAALTFVATLPPAGEQPSWVRDTVRAIDSGLMTGISPGFVVPPRDVVPNAETLTPEPGNRGVMIRDVNEALLLELSVVTRPVYRQATVRDWGGLEAIPRNRRRVWL